MLKLERLICIILTILTIQLAHSNDLTEPEKIEWLINQVKESEVKFLRNGDTHSSIDAAKHLSFKLKTAKNMFWFFGPKKSFTVNEFINNIASKSSSSGQIYKVRLKNGKTVTTKEWMEKKLKLLIKK